MKKLHGVWILSLLATTTLLLWGCPSSYDVDDDDVADDDLADDDVADDDAADDDTGDDDTGDDDTGDDDTGDDDTGDDDTVDAASLEGLVYWLQLGTGGFTYVEPAGIEAIFGGLLPEDEGMLLSPLTIDEGAGLVDVLIGSGGVIDPELPEAQWEWEQFDNPTTHLVGTWNNPRFSGGPIDLTITAAGVDIWLGDAIFSGRFNVDGTEIQEVGLEGIVDVVAFDLLLGFDPGTLCDTLAGLGITCVTCPPTALHQGDYCLELVLEDGVCPLLDGFEMIEVS